MAQQLQFRRVYIGKPVGTLITLHPEKEKYKTMMILSKYMIETTADPALSLSHHTLPSLTLTSQRLEQEAQ